MKISLFAIFPVVLAIGFCLGEWRAGNIQENIRKESEQQHKQEPLPKPSIVDPQITETFKVFKQSHGTLKGCIREARQITDILINSLSDKVSFSSFYNEHDLKYAKIDYDKSLKQLIEFKKYLMDRCPGKEKDGLELCEAYCDSGGEDYSEVIQMSYGLCTCQNSEGLKATEGYHQYINNKCEGRPDKDE